MAAGLILTLVARPVSVVVSSLGQGLTDREVAFLSWAGLRGAVPVVLATIPLAADVDGATRLFDLVFVLVVAFTLLTGPTLPLVARLLGVARVVRPPRPRGRGRPPGAGRRGPAAGEHQPVLDGCTASRSASCGCRSAPRSRWWSASGQTLVPERRTVLRHGDDLLVVTPRRLRAATEERLRQVSAGGRLARWLGTRPADG